MTLFFVQNPMSAYYKSRAFDRLLTFVGSNARRCNLREVKGKRSLVVKDVDSVEQAVAILKAISQQP